MLKDFKEFAIRGNVMDLAVGVIIGAAFGKIVTSLVNDVVMPPIGAVGSVDFSNRFIPLTGSGTAFKTVAEAKAAGVATLNYGLFINEVINFLILSFCDLSHGAMDQQAEVRSASGFAHHEGMPILHFGNPSQGQPLPELHVTIGVKFGDAHEIWTRLMWRVLHCATFQR